MERLILQILFSEKILQELNCWSDYRLACWMRSFSLLQDLYLAADPTKVPAKFNYLLDLQSGQVERRINYCFFSPATLNYSAEEIKLNHYNSISLGSCNGLPARLLQDLEEEINHLKA